MSLFIFLLVVQAIVAATLVGVILIQRSEGGGLGIGGSPTGLMSARGAADFLTRATRWLAIVFVVLSIILAAIAAKSSTGDVSVDSTLDRAPIQSAPADTAPAQTAPAQTTPTKDNTVVVVTGFRKAYADAIRTKRDSIEIVDSINSDGLGRFPDLNVGEAIQRIPGVQLNREADSRNATISLRGLPGTFARTALNGGGFADPILSSATNTASTPLGAFDSDIFSSIAVVKSPDASDMAGGLSGNVDLRIAPAIETLRSLPDGEPFDFCFIDADKTGYPDYYEEAVRLVRPGGLIALDNVFRGGDIINPDVMSEGTVAMRAVNDTVRDDDRVTAAMISVADGITLAIRN